MKAVVRPSMLSSLAARLARSSAAMVQVSPCSLAHAVLLMAIEQGHNCSSRDRQTCVAIAMLLSEVHIEESAVPH